jgi:hypothetical protein
MPDDQRYNRVEDWIRIISYIRSDAALSILLWSLSAFLLVSAVGALTRIFH